MNAIPDNLQAILKSPVLANAFPGITWHTSGPTPFGEQAERIAVTIPGKGEYELGIAPELAQLTPDEMKELIESLIVYT